jgi:hypothetical protein
MIGATTAGRGKELCSVCTTSIESSNRHMPTHPSPHTLHRPVPNSFAATTACSHRLHTFHRSDNSYDIEIEKRVIEQGRHGTGRGYGLDKESK